MEELTLKEWKSLDALLGISTCQVKEADEILALKKKLEGNIKELILEPKKGE